MRIAQCLQSLFDVSRGTETLVKNVSMVLADRCSVDVISGPGGKLTHKNIKVYGFPYIKRDDLPPKMPSELKYVTECSSFLVNSAPHFRKHRYDAVHIHIPVNLMLKSVTRDPLLLNFHGANPAYKDIMQSIAADGYCACSGYIADWASKIVKNKVHVAYDGVDIGYFKPMNIKRNDGKTVLLYLGALLMWKGFEYMLDAMEILQHRNRNIELWIAGKGTDGDRIKEMIRARKLKNVRMLGFIPQGDIVKLYNSCDAFISASPAEPFGITFIEAMACGKPVIAANYGGPREIVAKNTGFLARPKSASDLAEKILKAGDSDLKAMGENARERVIKNFTWEKTADSYMKIYQKM